MADAYIFVPESEIDKNKNIEDFMLFVEENFPPIDSVDYESNYWHAVCNFTKFGVNANVRQPSTLLHTSLIRFAKAYITYCQTLRRTKQVNEISAFRALDKALGEGSDNIDITSLKACDFECAAQASRESNSKGVHYHIGRVLKNLHVFLTDNSMIDKFPWCNPFSKAPYCSTSSDESDKRRQEKMPNEEALMALATISAQRTEMLSARDIFTTSAVTLLLSAPERGSELFYLKQDCLYKEKMTIKRALECGFTRDELKKMMALRIKFSESPNDIHVPDERDTLSNTSLTEKECIKDEDTVEVVGIKWHSGKGYGYANKWIPTVMIPAVECAIERLKTLSAPARAFAKLLEDSPDFPRHPLCPDVCEDVLLTRNEAVAALGFDLSGFSKKQMSTSGTQILRRKGINTKDYSVSLRDLNKIIRNNLNDKFPYVYLRHTLNNVPLRWSEALFSSFSNLYVPNRGQVATELWMPTINILNKDLGSSRNNPDYKAPKYVLKTLFERWGYGNLSLRSHQMRHLLDTMALVNGMGEMARAKWAQRANPRHNQYYDHTTPDEYGEDFARSQDIESFLPPVVIDVLISTPKTIQELKTKASLTAHTTEFGMCVSSYLSEPCGKYRDCVNCNEHILLKGDNVKCERLRCKLKMEEGLLLKDQKAVDSGVPGATQWLERRILTVERCREIIRFLSNPDIKDGSLIKLDIQDYSPLDRAFIANNKKILPPVINYMRENKCSVEDLTGTEIIDLEAMVFGKRLKGLTD